jgi:Protein of unknown function (DUF1573)
MSRYCFVMLAGLVASAPAAAATWADSMFDELSKDFGSVARGPVQTHAFRVVNNTKQPVNISSVRVSCGCTSASAAKPFLNPGEETAIVARMDTSRFIGVKSVTIFVQFDRPTFEEVRLWVQANARNDFSVSPDGLAFGEVKRASSPSLSNTITFYGSQTKITEVKSESNYVHAAIKEVTGADGQPAYELTAKLREDVPIGKWYTDVWVKTNNPEYPQIRVPLTMEVESGLSVSPDAVSLGQVAVNGESERRVIIRGAKPFKITAVKGADGQLSVHDNTTESKAVHVLTVKLKPGKAGDLNRNLRIETDLLEDSTVEFEVSAQVTPE